MRSSPQIIPYQDSDLERFYAFVGNLLRSSRRRDGQAYALARIRHQLPAADADALALPGRAPSSRFDVLSSTPASSSSPRDQAGRRLDALTTKVGDGCGLDDEVALRFFRHPQMTEGFIDLLQGDACPLKGPTDVGTAQVKDAEVTFSSLIDRPK